MDTEFQRRIASAKNMSSIFLIILISSILLCMYFYMNLQKSKQELKEKEVILNKQNTLLLSAQDSLRYYLRLTDSLIQSRDSSIQSSDLKEGSKRVLELSENTKYLVGIYCLTQNKTNANTIKNYFSDLHYTVSAFHILAERPSWLSLKSTVLYYDNSTEKKAKKIASNLYETTGKIFEIEKGAGYGVHKGMEKLTFFIHYIE